MSQSTTYHGHWKSPDGNIDSYGYLVIEEDKVTLKLIGINNEKELEGVPGPEGRAWTGFRPEDMDIRHIASLNCDTLEGKCVSLFDLKFSASRGGFFLKTSSVYYEFIPTTILIGQDCIDNLENYPFTRLCTKLHNFSNWLPNSPFSYTISDNDLSKHAFIIDRNPKPIEISLPDMYIQFLAGSVENHSAGFFTFEKTGYVILLSDTPRPIGDFLIWLEKARALLCLFLGRSLEIQSTVLRTNNIEDEIEKSMSSFDFITYRGRKDNIKNVQIDPILSYLDVSDNLEELCTNYFHGDEKLSRAIESFILIAFDDNLMLEGKYIAIVSLIESLNSKSKTTLKGKILPILKDCWEIFQGRIDFTQENFETVIRHNRNAIAHADKSNKIYIADKTSTLYWLTESIKWVAYYLLLQRLEIPKEILIKRLQDKIGRTNLRLKPGDFVPYGKE